MSDFANHAVRQLDNGALLLVSAMREWMHGAYNRRCVCATIDSAFATSRIAPAAAPFHRLMRMMFSHSMVSLCFGQRDRTTLTAHEALLLSTFAHAQQHPGEAHAPLVRIAGHLLHAPKAPAMADLIERIAATLNEAGLKVAPREPGMSPATLGGIVRQAIAGLPPALRATLGKADAISELPRDI